MAFAANKFPLSTHELIIVIRFFFVFEGPVAQSGSAPRWHRGGRGIDISTDLSPLRRQARQVH